MANQPTATEALQKTIKSFKTLGIVILVIGILALIYPNGFGKVSAISIGACMILGGHFRMTLAIVAKSMGSIVLKFMFGLTMIFAGTGFIGNPDMALTTLTFAMILYLIVDGTVTSVYGYSLLSLGKGMFLLANGIISIVLAALVYMNWPESSHFILGIYIGVKLVIDGITLFLTGNMLK